MSHQVGIVIAEPIAGSTHDRLFIIFNESYESRSPDGERAASHTKGDVSPTPKYHEAAPSRAGSLVSTGGPAGSNPADSLTLAALIADLRALQQELRLVCLWKRDPIWDHDRWEWSLPIRQCAPEGSRKCKTCTIADALAPILARAEQLRPAQAERAWLLIERRNGKEHNEGIALTNAEASAWVSADFPHGVARSSLPYQIIRARAEQMQNAKGDSK